jgi:formylglycine-generating enzyme required for sulfatase activity
MALLEWCEVPEGDTTIEYSGRNITYFVEPFRIGKYPVTNTQYQTFVDAKDGYADEKWWDFSTGALEWRKAHPEPLKPKFSMGDHPRANVCWFEARAFCRWLSAKTGLQIELPTEQQWQRAAQGDDELNYPWGNKFTKTKCNTRESKLKMTTAVSRYKSGLSVYGAHDMAGNVWEWCRNTEYGKQQQKGKNASLPPRAVRGGSFISVPQRARTTFHFYLNPAYRYATIGFRLAVAGKADESKSD